MSQSAAILIGVMERADDTSRIAIHRIATDAAISSAFKSASYELNSEIKRKIPRPAPDSEDVWEPVTIVPFLDSCRRLVEQKLEQYARGYSSLRWLWYLRRLPSYTCNTAFAEVISGYAGARDSGATFKNGVVKYDIYDSVINRVLKFWGGTDYLSRIYEKTRQAGAGVRFCFGGEALPQPRYAPGQKQSLRLFDGRVREGGPLFNRVGTVIASDTPSGDDMLKSIMVTYIKKQPGYVTVFEATTGAAREVEVRARYQPRYITLEGLTSLNDDSRLAGWQWWHPRAGTLLMLLEFAGLLVMSLQAGLAQLCQYGYFVMKEQAFKEVVNAHIAQADEVIRQIIPDPELPSNAGDFLTKLEEAGGSLWPAMPGPPIRRESNILCVDLFSTTWQLNNLFEYPRETGCTANARAEHFERVVQELIDSSPWAPPESIKKLRRAKLKKGERVVTDIDAIGVRGETLLIVDCLSTYISTEYEIGNHAAIRNAASNIEDKVIKWAEKKKFLEENPVGNNYHFSGYKSVVGVVCTPDAFYVPVGPATRFAAPGLIAAPSLSELRAWLNQPDY